MSKGPEAAAKPRRPATREDIVQIAVQLSCRFPKGPTDVERRGFIVSELERQAVDMQSFDEQFDRVLASPVFDTLLADGMARTCPEVLRSILQPTPATPPQTP